MEPSGNASLAAMFSRKGVFGPTVALASTFRLSTALDKLNWELIVEAFVVAGRFAMAKASRRFTLA